MNETMNKRIAKLPGAGWLVSESLVVFLIGVVLMNYIHSGPTGVQPSELGVAGHDSFYHIKMAALLPEHGLVKTFPWLKFTYFTDEGDAFVSHHYGFHAMLVPFVPPDRGTRLRGSPRGGWCERRVYDPVFMVPEKCAGTPTDAAIRGHISWERASATVSAKAVVMSQGGTQPSVSRISPLSTHRSPTRLSAAAARPAARAAILRTAGGQGSSRAGRPRATAKRRTKSGVDNVSPSLIARTRPAAFVWLRQSRMTLVRLPR